MIDANASQGAPRGFHQQDKQPRPLLVLDEGRSDGLRVSCFQSGQCVCDTDGRGAVYLRRALLLVSIPFPNHGNRLRGVADAERASVIERFAAQAEGAAEARLIESRDFTDCGHAHEYG